MKNNHLISTDRTQCPACRQQSIRSFFQPSLLPHRSGIWLHDCQNPDCTMYMQTLAARQWMQRYMTSIDLRSTS